MTIEESCFQLVHRRNKRRAGTAVVIFPGIIPTYSDLADEVKLFSRFGDVYEFHYPNQKVGTQDLYSQITDWLREWRYKKLVFVGLSFGGTLAYLLIRHWKARRINMGVRAVVMVSTPLQPENLTPRSQFQMDIGWTADRYARKLFIWLMYVMKGLWWLSFGWTHLAAREAVAGQTANAIRIGFILKQDWLVKMKLPKLKAILLNTRDGVVDPFVTRTNELDFREIFPNGLVLRKLNGHADIREVPSVVKHEMLGFVEEALKGD